MADVSGKFFSATKVRTGVSPSSPGVEVGETLPPVNPPGGGLNSVGLTMPSAFAVANSPLTSNGTLAVTGAGTVAQYVRGDGSLADFPATTGGGASVSYYLNGSVSQGTIGGVAYREFNRMPVFGAGTDITTNSDGYIASFITDAGDPNKLLIPAGNWNLETYFSASSGGGSPTFYVELYKYDGSTFTLIASNSGSPELIAFGTNLNPYFSTLAVPQTTLALTDRLALRYYVNTSGRTITLHTENDHLCQVITTFTTGLTALNGLTAQVQFFAVGTSGNNFNISSSTDTHTFNLPTASATNRGALSSADWTTFNNKQNALTNPVTGTGSSGQVAYWSSGSAITGESNLFYDSTNDRLGVGTDTPSARITVRGNGVGSAIDWINTEPVTGRSYRWVSLTQGGFAIEDLSVLPVAERLRITPNGNLHIGPFTSDNNSRLQVNGTATFSDSVTANSLIIANNDARIRNNDATGRIILGNSITNTFVIFHGSSHPTNANETTFANGGVTTCTFTSIGNAIFDGNVTANSFIKSGGTSTQFLKADGSVDSTTYVPVGRTITINGTTQDLSANRTFNVGTVTSVSGTGTVSGLTLSGTVTSSGNLTLGGTLSLTSGNVTDALGFTPYNATNPAGYITSSALSAYLPLAGGTLTGALNGTSASFTGDVQTSTRLIATNSSNSIILTPNLAGTTNRIESLNLPLEIFTSGSELKLRAGAGNAQLVLTSSGRLLIGSPPPTESTFTLDVNGGARFTNSTRVEGSFVIQETNTPQQSILLNAIPTNGNTIGILRFGARWNSTTYGTGAEIRATAAGTWSSTNYGSNLTFSTVTQNTDVNSERMRITAGGNVGIGTLSPANPLVVQGSNSAPQFRIIRQENTNQGFTIRAGGGETFFNSYDGSNIVYGSYLFQATKGSDTITRMEITNAGNVLIGTQSDNGNPLRVNGAIFSSRYRFDDTAGGFVTLEMQNSERWRINYLARFAGYGAGALTTDASGNITAASDSTLKDILKPVNNVLENIMDFNPVYFKWNKKTDLDKENVYMSTIAQSIQKHYPEAVGKMADGTLTVQDRALTAILVRAIQELKQEIDSLKN